VHVRIDKRGQSRHPDAQAEHELEKERMFCVQLNPSCIWQVDEHPSPETVLPSSHASVEYKNPSPHTIG
jgi:hypothetical protein